jgi:hypothetical protein
MHALILTVCLCAGPDPGPTEKYFPNGSLAQRPDMHDHIHARYVEAFRAFGEPSLLSLVEQGKTEGVELYRFTWLRSFHRPVCITVRTELAKVMLTVKVLEGKGGYDLKKLATAKTVELKREDFKRFEALLEDAEYRHMVTKTAGEGSWFWSPEHKTWLRAYGGGNDGATWMLERCSGNTYFFAERWCPSKTRFGKACLHLIKLAELEGEEVY